MGGLATVFVVPLLEAPYEIAKLVAKVITSAMTIARTRFAVDDRNISTSYRWDVGDRNHEFLGGKRKIFP